MLPSSVFMRQSVIMSPPTGDRITDWTGQGQCAVQKCTVKLSKAQHGTWSAAKSKLKPALCRQMHSNVRCVTWVPAWMHRCMYSAQYVLAGGTPWTVVIFEQWTLTLLSKYPSCTAATVVPEWPLQQGQRSAGAMVCTNCKTYGRCKRVAQHITVVAQ